MKIKLQRMSKSNVTHIIYGLDLVWSSWIDQLELELSIVLWLKFDI